MKYILSITITISLSIICFLTNNKGPLNKVEIPSIHHIEPEKKTDTILIPKKEVALNKQPIKKEIKKTQEITKSKEKQVIPSQPIKTEEQITSQYFSYEQLRIIKSELLQSINKERRSPVSLYAPLQRSANLRAKEAYQKWSHTRPNGTRWNTSLKDIINIQKTAHGENLAQYQLPYKESYTNNEIISMTKSIHQALVISPTHYKVMTNTNYKKVNIGIYTQLNNNILKITIAEHFIDK